MYLAIVNKGLAPVEGFKLFGVSTTRFDSREGTIGEFGSGTKYGIGTLLREGLTPIIFIGSTPLEFSTRPLDVDDGITSRQFREVLCNNKSMGFTLEHGVQDWTLDMALREFVCNAIDRTIRNGDHVTQNMIYKTETPKMIPEHTAIYIPMSNDVARYFAELSWRFLHFNTNESLLHETLIRKSGPCVGKVYKKGVYVGDMDQVSIFDYNFDGTFKLTEARTLIQGSVSNTVAQWWSKNATKADYIDLFTEIKKAPLERYLESTFDDWYYTYDLKQEVIQNLKEAWDYVCPKHVVCSDNFKEQVQRAHYIPIVMTTSWNIIFRKVDFAHETKVLHRHDLRGIKAYSPNKSCQKVFEKLWLGLDNNGLTEDKPQPILFVFRGGQNSPKGYVENKIVYINMEILDSEDMLSTMIEEIAHYVTEDDSHGIDFREYILKVAMLGITGKIRIWSKSLV